MEELPHLRLLNLSVTFGQEILGSDILGRDTARFLGILVRSG